MEWDDYFLTIAHVGSLRSPDQQTKVGCVIVNPKKHIVAVGYNGFPAKTDSSELPTVRPEKYPYMIHAEQNAISNMISKEDNLTAYITARPCLVCSKILWQNGIRRMVINDAGVIYSLTDDDKNILSFLESNGLEITFKNLKVEINVN